MQNPKNSNTDALHLSFNPLCNGSLGLPFQRTDRCTFSWQKMMAAPWRRLRFGRLLWFTPRPALLKALSKAWELPGVPKESRAAIAKCGNCQARVLHHSSGSSSTAAKPGILSKRRTCSWTLLIRLNASALWFDKTTFGAAPP